MPKKEKIKEAAALRYNPEKNSAPEVIAVGKGELAQKLLEIAENSSITIHEDAELAHVLSGLELGDQIPPELYEVVAEILVFVGNLDKGFGERYGSGQKIKDTDGKSR